MEGCAGVDTFYEYRVASMCGRASVHSMVLDYGVHSMVAAHI